MAEYRRIDAKARGTAQQGVEQIGGQARHVAADRQHAVEPAGGRIGQRARDAAQRPQPRRGQVGDAIAPADDHDGIDMAADPLPGMAEQRPAVQQGCGLVAAEAARSAACQDRPEDQATFSNRTGTDFAAGTWLCSALCVTGISTLHSG